MVDTGGVEFLGETYSHSLASVQHPGEFIRQAEAHSRKIKQFFNLTPSVFKNTELIYSDEIGRNIARMGFKAVLTEGSKRVLKWRSPNYLYANPHHPKFVVLFKNNHLSENLAFRLANPDWPGWPGVGNNYISLLNNLPAQEKVINLLIKYDLVGQGQRKISDIFNFLKTFAETILERTDYLFKTPSEIIDHQIPVSEIYIPELVSSEENNDEDLSTWIGNELQEEALAKLYSINDKIENCPNPDLWKDWQYLQSTDHFYYMSSKFFSSPDGSFLNPYNNPYEAFMNYMNILDDFINRVNESAKKTSRIFHYAKSREMIKEKSI
jgi:alpha-amylase